MNVTTGADLQKLFAGHARTVEFGRDGKPAEEFRLCLLADGEIEIRSRGSNETGAPRDEYQGDTLSYELGPYVDPDWKPEAYEKAVTLLRHRHAFRDDAFESEIADEAVREYLAPDPDADYPSYATGEWAHEAIKDIVRRMLRGVSLAAAIDAEECPYLDIDLDGITLRRADLEEWVQEAFDAFRAEAVSACHPHGPASGEYEAVDADFIRSVIAGISEPGELLTEASRVNHEYDIQQANEALEASRRDEAVFFAADDDGPWFAHAPMNG